MSRTRHKLACARTDKVRDYGNIVAADKSTPVDGCDEADPSRKADRLAQNLGNNWIFAISILPAYGWFWEWRMDLVVRPVSVGAGCFVNVINPSQPSINDGKKRLRSWGLQVSGVDIAGLSQGSVKGPQTFAAQSVGWMVWIEYVSYDRSAGRTKTKQGICPRLHRTIPIAKADSWGRTDGPPRRSTVVGVLW